MKGIGEKKKETRKDTSNHQDQISRKGEGSAFCAWEIEGGRKTKQFRKRAGEEAMSEGGTRKEGEALWGLELARKRAERIKTGFSKIG